LSSDRLTPFSYAILVLVGRGGAGPHDLRRMSEQGRVFWDAAASQWYAEPKRLAALGYLTARKEPGRTRERTHYELTEAGRTALAEWVRTPAALPRMQHETVVRLLAADLVDPAAVLEGLSTLGADIDEQLAYLARARAGWGPELAHRARLLETNQRYAERLLALKREWLAEAERVLRG
jgi:PadR family transcriptional regulator, regulatory protein AphA